LAGLGWAWLDRPSPAGRRGKRRGRIGRIGPMTDLHSPLKLLLVRSIMRGFLVDGLIQVKKHKKESFFSKKWLIGLN
jgi:hypothetical protein